MSALPQRLLQQATRILAGVVGMSVRPFRLNAARSAFALVLLAVFCLASLAPARPGSSAPAGQGEPVFASWQVLSEGRDEARYRLSLDGGVYEGLEFRWYGLLGDGGLVDTDRVDIGCYDTSGRLVGFFWYGRENDGRDSVGGWHIAYLILPQRAPLGRLEVRLYQAGGSPRLARSLSAVRGFNPVVDNQFYPFVPEGKVSWSGYESLPRGKVWLHAAGLGTIWGWGAPQKAAVDYVVWKSFAKPAPPPGFNANPDIYVDAGYAGTINVTGEGWTGQGGYAVAVQAGVGQGSWINSALAFGKGQWLWKVVSHTAEGYIQDVVENEANGIADIVLDATQESILKQVQQAAVSAGKEAVKGGQLINISRATAAATALNYIGYARFVFDCLLLISTVFTLDEQVARTKTVVFENVPLASADRVHAWVRLKGVAAASGFAHSVVSFYRDGTIEGNLNGNRGIEIGGILLHYQGPQSPEVIGSSPAAGATNIPVRPEIKLTLAKNLGTASSSCLDSSKLALKKSGSAQSVPLDCRIEVSSGGATNTLKITPKQDLEGNSAYELIVQAGAVKDAGGRSNLAPFALSFVTGTPLVVLDTNPKNGAGGVPLNPTTTFTFNKNVTPVSLNSIVLKNFTTGQLVARVGQGASAGASGAKLTLTLSSTLAPDQTYTWELPWGALKDASGNPNLPYSLAFRTAPLVKVVSTDPKDRDRDVPVSQPITVTLSRKASAGPNFGNITLRAGNAAVALDRSLSGAVLTLRPKQPLAFDQEYTVVIPEKAVVDPETGAPSAPYSFSFRSAVPPRVAKTIPGDSAAGAYRDQAVWVTFSEEVKKGPDFSRIAVKAGNASVPCDAGVESDALILTPRTPFPANRRITVSIPKTAVTDLRGTALQQDYTFAFTTGSGGTPPRVWWTSPADGEEGVSLQPVIYVRFTKNVQPGPNWGGIALKTGDGQAVQAGTLISYGSQLEIRPASQLKHNTVYVVTLPAGCVKEGLGSPSEGPVVFRFRTQYLSGPHQPQ